MEAGEVVPRNPLITTNKLEVIVSQTGNSFHIIATESDKLSRFIITLLINFESSVLINVLQSVLVHLL